MRFEELLIKLREHSFFDLATVVQLTDERRGTIQTQLYRWCRKGKLIPLRRGMYTFQKPYISRAINPAELANNLYTPSYLSTYWALGYYGLIPEKVVTYTSISSRVPRTFENAFGMFTYRHIKSSCFFGYRPLQINMHKVLLAEPEKALQDLWHLETGKWTWERMLEMRFQNMELVNDKRLQEYAKRFKSPRITAIVEEWILQKEAEQIGTVQL